MKLNKLQLSILATSLRLHRHGDRFVSETGAEGCEALQELLDRELAAAIRGGAGEAPDSNCVIGEYCREHGFIHGAEAEELRERLEKLVPDDDDTLWQVRAILDDVDARDSAAFVCSPEGMVRKPGWAKAPPEPVKTLARCARAFIGAFGGDIPKWIQAEADALWLALEEFK